MHSDHSISGSHKAPFRLQARVRGKTIGRSFRGVLRGACRRARRGVPGPLDALNQFLQGTRFGEEHPPFADSCPSQRTSLIGHDHDRCSRIAAPRSSSDSAAEKPRKPPVENHDGVQWHVRQDRDRFFGRACFPRVESRPAHQLDNQASDKFVVLHDEGNRPGARFHR